MSVLAIDYGDIHLGVAYSPDGKLASPFSPLNTKEICEKVKKVNRVCEDYGISQIVIGLALDQKGNLSKQAKKAKEFGEKLEQSLGVKVCYWNETLTSTDALQKMLEAGVPKEKRKELKHSFAAQIILQEYLDAHRSERQNF